MELSERKCSGIASSSFLCGNVLGMLEEQHVGGRG